MAGPSQYVREKREAATRRRLEVAKMLRDDPSATNVELAQALNVNRETIALDRKILMDDLRNQALTETEQFWFAMCERLQRLDAELELHRQKNGRLSQKVIHEMHLITRTLLEWRVPRPEQRVAMRKLPPIKFETEIVGGPTASPSKVFEMKEPLALTPGEPDEEN